MRKHLLVLGFASLLTSFGLSVFAMDRNGESDETEKCRVVHNCIESSGPSDLINWLQMLREKEAPNEALISAILDKLHRTGLRILDIYDLTCYVDIDGLGHLPKGYCLTTKKPESEQENIPYIPQRDVRHCSEKKKWFDEELEKNDEIGPGLEEFESPKYVEDKRMKKEPIWVCCICLDYCPPGSESFEHENLRCTKGDVLMCEGDGCPLILHKECFYNCSSNLCPICRQIFSNRETVIII